jgi:hypothetical protein
LAAVHAALGVFGDFELMWAVFSAIKRYSTSGIIGLIGTSGGINAYPSGYKEQNQPIKKMWA